MLILAIETSCDETSVALYNTHTCDLKQRIYSQIAQHRPHGGVVPEIAARSHLEILPSLCAQLIKDSGYGFESISHVAYTRGPGLVGPLLVGASFAKSLAQSLQVPCLPIHHLEAHLCIPMHEFKNLTFPFLCLLVSGGHTMLVHARSFGDYQILGQSLDDAAGEAFDKGGKCLGLKYPAGPEVARQAEKGRAHAKLTLPQPLKGKQGYDFSFSGLKTAFSRHVATQQEQGIALEDYCFALQQAIVDHLVSRLTRCMQDLKQNLPIVIAGGVAANTYLREQCQSVGKRFNTPIYYPKLEYCTDNAAMIAYTAALCLKHRRSFTELGDVTPRWNLETLSKE